MVLSYRKNSKIISLCLLGLVLSYIPIQASQPPLHALATTHRTYKHFVRRHPVLFGSLGALVTMLTISKIDAKIRTYLASYDLETQPGIKPDVPTVFAHGFKNRSLHGKRYHVPLIPDISICYSKYAPIEGPLRVFNFQDHYNITLSCVGQEGDMQRLYDAFKDLDECKFMLCSRGSKAGINMFSTARYQKLIQQKKLIVVAESPVDDVRNVISQVANYKKFAWIPTPILNFLLQITCRNYNPFGIQPIKVIHKFPKDIPLLLVCSKYEKEHDPCVDPFPFPSTGAVELYIKLLKAGHHDKVHLVVLDHGIHSHIIDEEKDNTGETYRNVIHAFWQHYGFSANEEWAQAGKARFSLCQPTLSQAQAVLRELKK